MRQAQLDEGRRFIDLAQKLKAPYIRVFGDKVPAGEQKRDVMARVIDGLRTLGEHAKGSGVMVLLETHGDYTDSPTVVELMKGASMDTVGLVWDAHHTFVAGKEQPSATWAALKPWVRHTHLKDSRPEGTEVRYVLTGKRDRARARAGPHSEGGRLQGLLRLRVGEGLAPGDRGAGGRVPALRRDDSSLPELVTAGPRSASPRACRTVACRGYGSGRAAATDQRTTGPCVR